MAAATQQFDKIRRDVGTRRVRLGPGAEFLVKPLFPQPTEQDYCYVTT